MQMPHCDPSILHGPLDGCKFCNEQPDWQELREAWRINFSGHNDPDKAPCPSTYFRPEAVINKWGGNVRTPEPGVVLVDVTEFLELKRRNRES